MRFYPFCLAWNWEYDADLAALLEAAGRARGAEVLQVTPANLEQAVQEVRGAALGVGLLLDRASDADERFLELVRLARERGARQLNPHEAARHSWDKAAMHRLLAPLLPTVPTVTLPPYAEWPENPVLDAGPLGEQFTLKPAHGGGGEGVVLAATSLEQIQEARQEHPEDRYLLQRHIVPLELGGRPAWFRVLYCTGQAFPCWWHPQSHRYTVVTAAEEDALGLGALRTMAATIARASAMDLFSSEMALLPEGGAVVVDYVNDPLDLRLQSRAYEGVPDEIVATIVERLIESALRERVGGFEAAP